MILDPSGDAISDVLSENEGTVYADIDNARCVVVPGHISLATGLLGPLRWTRPAVTRSWSDSCQRISCRRANKLVPVWREDQKGVTDAISGSCEGYARAEESRGTGLARRDPVMKKSKATGD
jgi:hypothetical protein